MCCELLFTSCQFDYRHIATNTFPTDRHPQYWERLRQLVKAKIRRIKLYSLRLELEGFAIFSWDTYPVMKRTKDIRYPSPHVFWKKREFINNIALCRNRIISLLVRIYVKNLKDPKKTTSRSFIVFFSNSVSFL